MIKDLNAEQREVLDEFLKNAKNTTGILSPSDFHYRMEYIRNYGEGEDLELFNDNFYELIESNELTKNQTRKLARIISKRECKWIISDNMRAINPKLITEQGDDYVVLEDGTRIDDARSYLYKIKRDKYNELQKERLAKSKTNGKEFLDVKSID